MLLHLPRLCVCVVTRTTGCVCALDRDTSLPVGDTKPAALQPSRWLAGWLARSLTPPNSHLTNSAGRASSSIARTVESDAHAFSTQTARLWDSQRARKKAGRKQAAYANPFLSNKLKAASYSYEVSFLPCQLALLACSDVYSAHLLPY